MLVEEPIVLQEPTVSDDGQGGKVPTGSTNYRTLRAKVEEKQHRLNVEDKVSFTSYFSIEVTKNPSKPINESHWVIYRGDKLRITHVLPSKNRRKVLLKCVKV